MSNWYKKAQEKQEKKVIVTGTKMYFGKYPKITFIIKPELPGNLGSFLRRDITNDINERIRNGEKWLLSLMSTMKKKYGKGDITWIMFNKFQDGTYWVDPYYADYIAQKLLEYGYSSGALSALGNKGIEEGSLKIDGQINSEGIVMQILGRFPGFVKKKIKDLQFWGEKIGDKFFWNRKTKSLKEQLSVLEQLFHIEEFDVSLLKEKARSYYSELFNRIDPMELLKLKNEMNISGGFISEVIHPLIDSIVQIDQETGEIITR